MKEILEKAGIDAFVEKVRDGLYAVNVNDKSVDLDDVEKLLKKSGNQFYVDYSFDAKMSINEEYFPIAEEVRLLQEDESKNFGTFTVTNRFDGILELKDNVNGAMTRTIVGALPLALHGLFIDAMRRKIVAFPGTEVPELDRSNSTFEEVYSNLKNLVKYQLKMETSSIEYSLLSELLYVATGYEGEDDAMKSFNMYVDRALNDAENTTSPVFRVVLLKFMNKVFRSDKWMSM